MASKATVRKYQKKLWARVGQFVRPCHDCNGVWITLDRGSAQVVHYTVTENGLKQSGGSDCIPF